MLMIPKKEVPIEVTLEQSSSGTWEAPESQKNQFKPWQRLWFATGVIYLLLLVGSYYVLIPTQESIERSMVFAVTEEVRRYDGLVFAGESPRKIYDIARSQGYAAWIAQIRSKYRIGKEGNAGFDTVEKGYQKELSALPRKRLFGLLLCVIAWVGPMSFMYLSGLLIDWIKRGKCGIQD
jgi:hypothetical protein